MTKQKPHAAAKGLLALHTGTDPADWYLVFKARYGLEAVFRALREKKGAGAVTTQLFTCATAVNPILAGGLTPEYGEIAPDTIALDPNSLELGPNTHAVVLQHTFGIISSSTASALKSHAKAAGAVLVEDSAHCVGRMAKGRSGHPLADVSVHSFGVEKILSTTFGGAVWINPELESGVADSIRNELHKLGEPSRKLAFAVASYRIQRGLLNRLPSAVSAPLRRFLIKLGLFDPPIAERETRGQQGAVAPLGANSWVARHIGSALEGLSVVEAQRSAATAEYLARLKGKVEIPAEITPAMPLVRFPIFVPAGVDAEHVFERLRGKGIYSGRWYRPSLFPGVTDPTLYNWTPASELTPVTDDLSARVVNLPTNVDPADAGQIAKDLLNILDVAQSSP